MKVGFLSDSLPYLPCTDGFRLHAANLIRCLSRRHDVHLVSLLRPEDADRVDWVERHCASVVTIPAERPGLPMRFANFITAGAAGYPLHQRGPVESALLSGLRTEQWDVLHVEGAYVAGLVPRSFPLAKVLSLHDSFALRCREILKCSRRLDERLYYSLLSLWEPLYERLVYPRFERCVVVAERDAEAIRSVAPSADVAVIPQGTDSDHFHPLRVTKRDASIVFHGNFSYAPNIEAALELADHILPKVRSSIPEAELHLVGAKPAEPVLRLGGRPRVRLSADLDDLRPAVCSSRVYGCAIQHGTGTLNKMLEAMAMGLPIVCYPRAVAGTKVVPGTHALVVESREEFARAVVDLVRGPTFAERLAREARALVEQSYSWDARAAEYEDLYARVMDLRRRSHEAPAREMSGVLS